MAMTDRKKPGVAFWATVVVVVLLAYPISFGPACWIYSRSDHDDALSDFYLPIGLLFAYGPRFVIKPIQSWARVGMVPESSALVPFPGGRAIVINAGPN
jgi:hypothetical protein